jgi:hypothetical protein
MNASKPLAITLVSVSLATSSMSAGVQTAIAVQTQNAIYLNGGIGEDEAHAMRGRAAEFPLRLIFAEGPQNVFTANVPLAIVDERGNPVFALRDAGPMLYVMLPAGRYTVIAESDGIRKTQQVTLDHGRGTDVAFHWNTAASTRDAM